MTVVYRSSERRRTLEETLYTIQGGQQHLRERGHPLLQLAEMLVAEQTSERRKIWWQIAQRRRGVLMSRPHAFVSMEGHSAVACCRAFRTCGDTNG